MILDALESVSKPFEPLENTMKRTSILLDFYDVLMSPRKTLVIFSEIPQLDDNDDTRRSRRRSPAATEFTQCHLLQQQYCSSWVLSQVAAEVVLSATSRVTSFSCFIASLTERNSPPVSFLFFCRNDI